MYSQLLLKYRALQRCRCSSASPWSVKWSCSRFWFGDHGNCDLANTSRNSNILCAEYYIHPRDCDEQRWGVENWWDMRAIWYYSVVWYHHCCYCLTASNSGIVKQGPTIPVTNFVHGHFCTVGIWKRMLHGEGTLMKMMILIPKFCIGLSIIFQASYFLHDEALKVQVTVIVLTFFVSL